MKKEKKEVSELRQASLDYSHLLWKIKGVEKNLVLLKEKLNLVGWDLPIENLLSTLTARNREIAKKKGVTINGDVH